MFKTHYVIDLDDRTLAIKDYAPDTLIKDLTHFGLDTPSQLQTHDRRIFKTLAGAERFLEEYSEALHGLERIKGKPRMPALLLKRRWLPLTALGLKMHTERGTRKNWQPGQHIRLYDQTYYVEVVIKSIEPVDGGFRYSYDLA